jgi:hypothetical protein
LAQSASVMATSTKPRPFVVKPERAGQPSNTLRSLILKNTRHSEGDYVPQKVSLRNDTQMVIRDASLPNDKYKRIKV